MRCVTTREREVLAVMTTEEWLTSVQIAKLAGLTSSWAALQRALGHGVVERRLVAKGVSEWRRTGRDFPFNAGGLAWAGPCEAFEPGDEHAPLAEDLCGTCGRRFDAHVRAAVGT